MKKSIGSLMAMSFMLGAGMSPIYPDAREPSYSGLKEKPRKHSLPKLTVDGPTPKGAEIIEVVIGARKGRHVFEFEAEILRRSLKSYNKALVKLTHELQSYVNHTHISELLDKKEYKQIITTDDGQGILEK